MRESIGGAWILGIVMTFIVLFASFLAISINYSKAFKVKNNVVDIIEKNEGLTKTVGTKKGSVEQIYDYLKTEGYILKGQCSSGYTGFDMNGKSTGTDKSLYCVKKNMINDTSLDKAYYSVEVFFRLDLPIFGDIFTFRVSGETMSIYFAEDDYFI